jgi:hypothetical protein
LPNFGKIVQLLRGMLVRFLNVLHSIDVCFIADDTLEKLPTASRVGKTKVGGVDFNRPRMRAVAHAVTALATSPVSLAPTGTGSCPQRYPSGAVFPLAELPLFAAHPLGELGSGPCRPLILNSMSHFAAQTKDWPPLLG